LRAGPCSSVEPGAVIGITEPRFVIAVCHIGPWIVPGSACGTVSDPRTNQIS